MVLERCINHSRALHALRLFESQGVACVNTSRVASTCGDKLLTSVALQEHGVPQPEVRVAFTPESALAAIEEMGYPVVLKPAVGSWGRLLAKVNDRDAAEALLEHKTVLGSYHHSIFYIQKYVEKRGPRHPGLRRRRRVHRRDLPDVAALDHQHGARRPGDRLPGHRRAGRPRAWPARGPSAAASWPSTSSRRPTGLLVNEVNYTMEFKNSIAPTGVNIPARIVDLRRCGQAAVRGMSRLRVSIVGGSGYVGGELLRLLLAHPQRRGRRR